MVGRSVTAQAWAATWSGWRCDQRHPASNLPKPGESISPESIPDCRATADEDDAPMTKQTFQLLVVLMVGSILLVAVVDLGVDLLMR
jgi:hypothetical protein